MLSPTLAGGDGALLDRFQDRVTIPSSPPAGPANRPGVYLSSTVCGRLLNIQWATRSIVCSCGARIVPTPAKEKQA